jgi:rubrerythrin
MNEAQPRLVEALKFAIQMELDGKQYYLQACEGSIHPVGKELFAWLAKQEDHHRLTFEKIFKSIAAQQGWPTEHIRPDGNVRFGTIFGEAINNAGKDFKASKEEIEFASKAMEMELKSRDYYKKQAELATSNVEKSFFNALSAEEQGHYLGLVDYKEYISDPVDWFTRTEHHLLDGA